MNGVFHIGATGLSAQDRGLQIVANNITNMNTPGFKRAEMRFAELIGPAAPAAAGAGGPADTDAVDTGLPGDGAPAAGVERNFMAGERRATGNPLDIAIAGDGFIELTGPDGQTLLWRGGTLSVTEDGFLAGANGP